MIRNNGALLTDQQGWLSDCAILTAWPTFSRHCRIFSSWNEPVAVGLRNLDPFSRISSTTFMIKADLSRRDGAALYCSRCMPMIRRNLRLPVWLNADEDRLEMISWGPIPSCSSWVTWVAVLFPDFFVFFETVVVSVVESLLIDIIFSSGCATMRDLDPMLGLSLVCPSSSAKHSNWW